MSSEDVGRHFDLVAPGYDKWKAKAHYETLGGTWAGYQPRDDRDRSCQAPDLMEGPWNERFDFVVAADVAEHVPDLAKCMTSMAGMLTSEGRIVLVMANPAWGPVLHAAERLKLKMPEGDHTWRSRERPVRRS